MIDPAKFGEYKAFIEDTARFTDRRQTISNTFVVINSLLLTVISYSLKDSSFIQPWKIILTIPLILAGILVSVWWRQLIRKYKKLVNLRIRLLREMENSKELSGLVKMYHAEDELYPRDENGKMLKGKGLNFSDLEAKLPLLFIGLYTLFLIFFYTLFVTVFWGDLVIPYLSK